MTLAQGQAREAQNVTVVLTLRLAGGEPVPGNKGYDYLRHECASAYAIFTSQFGPSSLQTLYRWGLGTKRTFNLERSVESPVGRSSPGTLPGTTAERAAPSWGPDCLFPGFSSRSLSGFYTHIPRGSTPCVLILGSAPLLHRVKLSRCSAREKEGIMTYPGELP